MSRPPSRSPAMPLSADLSDLHQSENARLRDPAQIVSHWSKAGDVDPRLLEYEVQGEWWDVLAECGITLLVTREYENIVMAMQATDRISYLSLPHPSGLVVDRRRMVVHIASTRNPNQIFDLVPIAGMSDRLDVLPSRTENELIPIRSRVFPGCLYVHDLAIISEHLYSNAVGENAVVRSITMREWNASGGRSASRRRMGPFLAETTSSSIQLRLVRNWPIRTSLRRRARSCVIVRGTSDSRSISEAYSSPAQPASRMHRASLAPTQPACIMVQFGWVTAAMASSASPKPAGSSRS